jgi:hypothetical protein
MSTKFTTPNTKREAARLQRERELTVVEILKIEELAMRGLGHDNIAVLLGLSPEGFHRIAGKDPRVSEAMLIGRNKGIAAVSKTLLESAISGRDTGAARFYLERVAGGTWAPPRASPPMVVIESKPYDPNEWATRVEHMERRFERQRLLLEGKDIDDRGRIIDLEVGSSRSPEAVYGLGPKGTEELG